MKFSQEIFTRQISWLAALKLETKQRLSYTLSFMEQEIPKSEVSLEELQETAVSLGNAFYETHLLLKLYESELDKLL